MRSSEGRRGLERYEYRDTRRLGCWSRGCKVGSEMISETILDIEEEGINMLQRRRSAMERRGKRSIRVGERTTCGSIRVVVFDAFCNVSIAQRSLRILFSRLRCGRRRRWGSDLTGKVDSGQIQSSPSSEGASR
jgi:hypothetical protein